MRSRVTSSPLRRALPAIAAIATLSAGCDDNRAPFSIEIVTAAGTDPVAGAGTGRLRVLVAQDGQPTRDQGVDLVGGTFQLDVAIADFGVPTRIGVELVRDGVTSIGALPSFAPVGFPFVRVPVVPRGTCATLAPQRFATARVGHALVTVDALVLVIGGLDGTATPAPVVERFTTHLLTADEGSIAALRDEVEVGRARALRLASTSHVLVISSASAVDLNLTQGATPVRTTVMGLPAGAGERSAIVDLSGNGVALVGGASGADGLDVISWVTIDRAVTTSALPTARRDAAATSWGSAEGVLVAGGNATGDATFLFVPTALATRENVIAFGLEGEEARVLRGGALVRSPEGTAALLVGAIDESGEVTDETFLVTGCPSACTVAEGPTWAHPRTGFAFTQTGGGAWIVGGRDASGIVAEAERITWTGTTPTLTPLRLAAAREDAAITPIAGGLVLVGGGRDASGVRDDLELCAPDQLEAL
ncbi:MAG: hypothetical protein J0L92_27085 [Deltaproteobacteria bacterium]|nr:hypothetical protein [Deltaproteobacteria bacterium]